jgi:platelet-activating factor acetylhydrolase IB subunit beta/gamma
MRAAAWVVGVWLVAALAALGPARADVCPMPAEPPRATAVAIPAPEKFPQVQARIAHDLASSTPFGAIALGDSIIHGWPEPLLDRAIGTHVLNAGVGGEGSGRILWRLGTLDWSRQHPRTVLVLVGTNNLKRPPCEVYWGVRAVVSRVHQMFPPARVIVTSVLPRGERLLESDARIAEVNAALLDGAGSREYVFFDAHDALLCGHVTPCPLFQENLLHLTPRGYDVLSNALSDLVRRLPP